MNKNKLIYTLFLIIFTVAPAVLSANAATSGHNEVNFTRGVTIKKHRPVNPNSEFAVSSFTPSEEFISSVSSFSGKNGRLSKEFSIAKDSSFSNKSSSRPKRNDDEFLKKYFSIHDDAEFSGEPTSTPSYNNGEFSNTPTIPSAGSFTIQ